MAEEVYRAALADGRIGSEDKATIFYSKTVLNAHLAELKNGFPENTLHAIAIKTHSSDVVLKHIVDRGFGLEAASIGEVKKALAAGIDPKKLVFDSPVKTHEEIAFCQANCPGILLNANSIQELKRYPQPFNAQIGLRINPMSDPDVPAIFNVSQENSKFGVPLTQRQAILDACFEYGVEVLHLHIGSGSTIFEANVQAVGVVVELAHQVNEALIKSGKEHRIHTIDIGGGIEFSTEDRLQSAKAYADRLEATCQLFSRFNVITEFGKFVHQHNSFVVSDIEYVIESPEKEGLDTVFIHVGADLFLRKVYSSLPIQFPWSVIRNEPYDPEDERRYQIVGPLCFAGDVLYPMIRSARIRESDKIVMHDIGANTLSLWSRHCSREEPRLLFIK